MVDNELFWEGVQQLELGGIPNLQASVTVIGYPTGGDNISVTRGVVSRVVVGKYSHGGDNLLSIQIDAAITAVTAVVRPSWMVKSSVWPSRR
jgi:hypothetical protein